MGFRIVNGYIGSSDLLTSVAGEEIIPIAPSGTTYRLYKFEIGLQSPAKVSINGSDPIFISRGFETSEIDAPIYSFKILSSGILFNWIGGY